uniref:Ty3/gypsy retrotransposon protein n=1 Tax=Tanacetum cinerariifolium TaxID=118510 RepID=A0A699HP98_TANCI|nr:Ty3/gypsy retrotransposon protein [Tanacetum cinerariifolium]
MKESLVERDALLRKLKQNLSVDMHRMEMQANQNHHDVEFKSGDRVLVKLQPYRQITLAKCHYNKLSKRYYGSFEVLERVGKVAYRLAIPDSNKIHLVFHVSLLKLFVATWEMLSEFNAAYPSYHLEDKVVVKGVGNVTVEFDKPNDKEPTDDNNKSRPKRAASRPVWFKDYVTG